jgi:pSer/pThr/pTyr-binding forkhead associated (FHA) protein
VEARLNIIIMSGVDDGSVFKLDADEGEAHMPDGAWVITVGRHDDNDICLNNDTFVSRHHARIYCREDGLWLEDCGSTNGTFVETPVEDVQIDQTAPLTTGQLFRIGRTWMRIEQGD